MAEHLKLISPEVARPVLGQFINTDTATDILHSLGVVYQRPGEYVGLIAGAPGVGKSEAIWRFKRMTRGVFIHNTVQGEGGVWNLANELCRLLEIEPANGRRLPEERRRIAEACGPETMLIIDEAQYLVQRNTRGRDDWQAFEWLRFMAAEGMLSLVFLRRFDPARIGRACAAAVAANAAAQHHCPCAEGGRAGDGNPMERQRPEGHRRSVCGCPQRWCLGRCG